MENKPSHHIWINETNNVGIVNKDCDNRTTCQKVGVRGHGQFARKQNVCDNLGSYGIFRGNNHMEDVKTIVERADAVSKDKQERMEKIQQLVDNTLSEQSRQNILNILEQVSHLSGPERLLLYLKLPGGQSSQDPLRQPPNPLGTRHEISTTAAWVRTHLEHDPQVSVPKQDVYDEYLAYCATANLKPLSTADFGKVMKQVFPNLRPRRLGTRGHSRYCYAAMRKARSLAAPSLPDLSAQSEDSKSQSEAWSVVQPWAEKVLHQSFPSLESLAEYVNKLVMQRKDINPDPMVQTKAHSRDQRDVKKRMLPPITKTPRAKKMRGLNNNSGGQSVIMNPQNAPRNMQIPPNINTNILQETNQHLKPEHGHLEETPERDLGFNNCYSTNIVNSLGFTGISTGIPLECTDVALNLADKPIKDMPKTCTNLVEDKSNYILPMNLSTDNLAGANINCDTVNIKEEIHDNELNILNKRKNIRKCNNAKKKTRTLSRRFSSGDLISRNNYMPNDKRESGNITNNSAHSSNIIYDTQTQVDIMLSPKYKPKPSTCVSGDYNFHPPEMQELQITSTSNNRTFENISRQEAGFIDLPKGIKEEFPTNIIASANVIPEIITESATLEAVDCDVKVKVEQDDPNPNTLDILPGSDIPRERVISICSLDKDALDGYLHGGDNSQEQEEELLQYFQQDSATKTEQNKNNSETKIINETPSQNRYSTDSLRCNQALAANQALQKSLDLSQLRLLLEKSVGNKKMENLERPPTYIKKYSQAVQDNLNFRQISASESLAILSQRQNSNMFKPLHKIGANVKANNNGLSARRHVSFDNNPVNAMKEAIPQGSSAGKKNCGFMPIPLSPLSPMAKHSVGNTSPKPASCNASPFVSPRNTPAFRSRPAMDKFMKCGNKNLQADGLPMATTMTNMNIRSQSVPLHMKNMVSPGQSPLFFNMQYQPQQNAQQLINYGNASTSSSVAATPVPTEYSDFDTPPIANFMDIMNPTSEIMNVNNIAPETFTDTDNFHQDDLSIPMTETEQTDNNTYPSMEMNQILPQTTDFTTDIRALKRSMSIENNFTITDATDDFKNIATRSVPSTPISYNKMSLDFPMPQQYKDFDMISKSVPSTPVRDRSFRYSPTYRSRDFLINGNSVDAFKNSMTSSEDGGGVIDNLSELEQQEAACLQITSSIEQEFSNFGPADDIMTDDIISELGGDL